MKENYILIYLSEIAGPREFLSGNSLGREVFQKLISVVEPKPGSAQVYGISLKGIQATDASFPRESVASLVKMFRGEVGFYLRDFASQDLLDNWDYAAKAKEQPIIVLENKGYRVIGPKLNEGMASLLDFIMSKGRATTSMVSKEFDVSAQNASAKLKKLHGYGLILGAKEVAESGGLEYVYKAIK